jgi:hypothetical protein
MFITTGLETGSVDRIRNLRWWDALPERGIAPATCEIDLLPSPRLGDLVESRDEAGIVSPDRATASPRRLLPPAD